MTTIKGTLFCLSLTVYDNDEDGEESIEYLFDYTGPGKPHVGLIHEVAQRVMDDPERTVQIGEWLSFDAEAKIPLRYIFYELTDEDFASVGLRPLKEEEDFVSGTMDLYSLYCR